jgi:hypothetical protein
MNNTLRTTLTILGVLAVAALLLLTGAWIGRAAPAMAGWGPGNMRAAYPDHGPGMMSGDMMNGSWMMGTGMPGTSGLYAASEPLTLEAAEQALEKFLDSGDGTGLAIGEIMIFDNHGYAQLVEESTGIGAMEVLVDPVTLAVYPEHGANMMWNLKYGPMTDLGGGPALSESEGMMGMMMGGGQGMMGGGQGMMGGYGSLALQTGEISAEMPVTPEQAVESAQLYLDANLPGAETDGHADPFYGYYTLHILRDGEIVGMLSINGYTRQVFPHTWHGEFIEMRGE